MLRAEANGRDGGGGAPPGEHLSEILVFCQVLWDLNAYFWRILRDNDAQQRGFISV